MNKKINKVLEHKLQVEINRINKLQAEIKGMERIRQRVLNGSDEYAKTILENE